MTLTKQALDFLGQIPVVLVTVEENRILDIRLVDPGFVAALALMARARDGNTEETGETQETQEVR